jgi:hypothetical protein
MPVRLEEFLAAKGFHADPFASTSAELEAETLPGLFVEGAWFDWLVGDPCAPQSTILFAPPGYGKTSHRMEVARRVGEGRPDPALIVIFNDVFHLVHPTRADLPRYLGMIRRLTLQRLDAELRQRPAAQAALDANPDAAARAYAFWKLYAPLCLAGRERPAAAAFYEASLPQHEHSPREILSALAALAEQAGYASVYLLLDGFDELTETRKNPQLIIDLLNPLIDNPGLLQECRYAFKFFLPNLIEHAVYDQAVGRLDRIPSRTLSYSEDELCRILARRLQHYSRYSAVSRAARVELFQDLCDHATPLAVDQHMARHASGSPRALLNLARDILHQHCMQTDSAERPIAATVVAAVLGDAPSDRPLAIQPPTPPPTLTNAGPSECFERDGIPLLYLDDQGQVWLGQRQVEPPLSKLLYKLLEVLWQHRGHLMRYDKLMLLLYDEHSTHLANPREAMEKLVRRLRESLESQQPSSKTYIETRKGIGFVLRNYRDK